MIFRPEIGVCKVYGKRLARVWQLVWQGEASPC
jgi:hypothetical protein